MEAKELRIGNYVKYETGTIYAVDMIYENYSLIDVWKPIVLTEEWLIKLGFNKRHNEFYLENFRFHINKPCNYDGFIFCEGYSVITDKIHFVHQLQNLYFALTGLELSLNTEM